MAKVEHYRGLGSDLEKLYHSIKQVMEDEINLNNKKGIVDAIPIIAYHIIDNSLNPSSTDINLFAAEMKYFHDNNFKVLPMSDLGYDQSINIMYIKALMALR